MFKKPSTRLAYLVGLAAVCAIAIAMNTKSEPLAPDEYAADQLGPLAVYNLTHAALVEAFRICPAQNGVGCPAATTAYRSPLPSPYPQGRIIDYRPSVAISSLRGLLSQLYNGENYRYATSSQFHPEYAWRFLGSGGESGPVTDVVVCFATGRVHINSWSSLSMRPEDMWISKMLDQGAARQSADLAFPSGQPGENLK